VVITYGVAITVARSDHAPSTLPRRRNQKAVRCDSHEERVAKAIKELKEKKELKENPNPRPEHVAAYHGLNNKTLFSRYCGRTLTARGSHLESRELTLEEEQAVVK